MKKPLFLLAVFFVLPFVVTAEEASATLSLGDAVNLALTQGADNKILQGNLEVAKAAHGLNVSKNNWNISASGSYGMGEKFNDNSLAASAAGQGGLTSVPLASSSPESSLSTGTKSSDGKGYDASAIIPANAQASLSVTSPLTKATVSGAHYFQVNPDGTLSNTSGLGLSLSQVIWDGYVGGAAMATVDKSAVTLQSSELTQQSSRLALILKVKQAYYTLLSAQENINTFQDTLAQRQQFLKILTSKFELKQASTIDLKTAQINERTSEIDLQNGQNVLHTARIRLALLIGWPADRDFRVVHEADPQIAVKSLDEAVQLAWSQRVELKQVMLNQQMANIDLNLVRGLATPSVTLSSAVNLLTDWQAQKSGQSLTFGVKIGFPLVDGGLLQNQVAGDSSQLQVYSVQYAQLRNSIAADIQDALATYRVKLQRLEVAQLTVEMQKAQAEITKAQNDAGTAKNIDLMTADVNYTNALFALAQARIDAQLAALQLQNALGS